MFLHSSTEAKVTVQHTTGIKIRNYRAKMFSCLDNNVAERIKKESADRDV